MPSLAPFRSYNNMPEPSKARDTSDLDLGIRIIRPLYPQQCLDQSFQPFSRASSACDSKWICTYQNTGVQTLPPPNGDIFKIIHGREPSQADYVRNMGTAALGRFAKDPRLNPFELIYGTTYPAPAKREGKFHVDSCFQTEGYDLTRKALARAKVKASIMVNRYREVALQAGYRVSAESRDDLIAHSEQFPPIVRLNAEGMLLEGSAEDLCLPNVHGTPIQTHAGTLQKPSAVTQTGHSEVTEVDDRTILKGLEAYTSPVHVKSSISQHQRIEPLANVAAFAPFSEEQTGDTIEFYDDEYGSVGSNMNDFVVYDAGAPQRPPTFPSTKTAATILQKRKGGSDQLINSRSKKPKVELSVPPRKSLTPTLPSSGLPLDALRMGSISQGATSSPANDNSHSSSTQHLQSRSGGAEQGNNLKISNPQTRDTQDCDARGSLQINEPDMNFTNRREASSPTPTLKREAPAQPRVSDELLVSRLNSAPLPMLRKLSTSIGSPSKALMAKARTATKASSLPEVSSQDLRTDDDHSLLEQKPSLKMPISLPGDSASLAMDHDTFKERLRNQSRNAKPAQRDSDGSGNKGNTPSNGVDSLRPSVEHSTLRSTSMRHQVISAQARENTPRAARKSRHPFTLYVPPAMRAKGLQVRDEDKARKDSGRK